MAKRVGGSAGPASSPSSILVSLRLFLARSTSSIAITNDTTVVYVDSRSRVAIVSRDRRLSWMTGYRTFYATALSHVPCPQVRCPLSSFDDWMLRREGSHDSAAANGFVAVAHFAFYATCWFSFAVCVMPVQAQSLRWVHYRSGFRTMGAWFLGEFLCLYMVSMLMLLKIAFTIARLQMQASGPLSHLRKLLCVFRGRRFIIESSRRITA